MILITGLVKLYCPAKISYNSFTCRFYFSTFEIVLTKAAALGVKGKKR